MPRANETPWEKGAGPVLIGSALLAGTATSIFTIAAVWFPYDLKVASALAVVTLVNVIALAIVGIHHMNKRGTW